jgi:aminoglycoside 6'-N-acetyltransferase
MLSSSPRTEPPARRPAPGTVTLRSATLADLPLLRTWDQDAAVRSALIDSDWHWETELQRNPPWREWLIAEADGRPVGFIQIIDPENEESRYWGCMDPGHRAIDIWIGEPDARNRGYGARMMAQALERCFADPAVHTVLIDPLASNTRAHRFYERLGFEFVVERAFGEDCCRVYRLTRERFAALN